MRLCHSGRALQPRHPGARDHPRWDQPDQRALPHLNLLPVIHREVDPGQGGGLPDADIDAGMPNRGQVDLQAAVTRRFPRVAVSAALDGEKQAPFPRKGYGPANIRDADRLHHQSRVLVDARVEDPTRGVVAGIPGQQQVATQAVRELLQHGTLDLDRCTVSRDSLDASAELGQRSKLRCK